MLAEEVLVKKSLRHIADIWVQGLGYPRHCGKLFENYRIVDSFHAVLAPYEGSVIRHEHSRDILIPGAAFNDDLSGQLCRP